MKIESVARCEKCGREFVWVNPESDRIDRYFPANKPLPKGGPPVAEQCGGKIHFAGSRTPTAMNTARDHAIAICEAIIELIDNRARPPVSIAVEMDRRDRLTDAIESALIGAAFVGAKTGVRPSEPKEPS